MLFMQARVRADGGRDFILESHGAGKRYGPRKLGRVVGVCGEPKTKLPVAPPSLTSPMPSIFSWQTALALFLISWRFSVTISILRPVKLVSESLTYAVVFIVLFGLGGFSTAASIQLLAFVPVGYAVSPRVVSWLRTYTT